MGEIQGDKRDLHLNKESSRSNYLCGAGRQPGSRGRPTTIHKS